MRKRRKRKGRNRVVYFILAIVVVFFFSGMIVINVLNAANQADANLGSSLELLTFSSEPVPAFSSSTLSQSFAEKKVKEIETVWLEKFIEQNRQDYKENVIYITFDDGPSHVTGQLLNMLDEYNMKATFFMMGPKMEENPEIVKRKHAEGHGLALHGITHEVAHVYGHANAPLDEMIEGQEILESITGVETEVIRLPYGSVPYLTEPMRYMLDRYDFKVWDWNVDSLDWKFDNSNYVWHTIQEIERVERAGEVPIVLLHDREETVKHLPKLLNYIKKQGYQTKVLTNDMAPYTFSCSGKCYSIN